MDLLGYSETVLHICLQGKTREEVNNVLRQVYVFPQKVRICPCGGLSPWTRKTLAFLGAVYDNEPSRECLRHGSSGELTAGAQEPARAGDQHAV